jgi:hypothetical protein
MAALCGPRGLTSSVKISQVKTLYFIRTAIIRQILHVFLTLLMEVPKTRRG